MTPAEIRLLFQSSAPAADLPPDDVEDIGDDDDEAADGLPAAERARRTAALRQVLADVQQTWLPGSSELNLAAEYLGDGSRDESWRRSIGESGLLDYFLGLLARVDDLPLPLKIHTLRLIGNSCADQDANRARVVDGAHLGRIVSLLQDDAILAFAIPVLYNICVDYEPAQLQASQSGLSRVLVTILSGPRLEKCVAFLNVICKLLALLVSQEPETTMADPATPAILLRLAADPAADLDVEDFSLLVSVALAYLAYETFQEQLIRQDAVLVLLTAFSDAYPRYKAADMDPDDANDYRALGTRFLNVLSDLTALDTFATAYPLASAAVVRLLQSWVADASSNSLLQTAACVSLGNLARSDQASIFLVHDLGIHIPLARLLLSLSSPSPGPSSPDDNKEDKEAAAAASVASAQETAQRTFAVLSFLKNLAIPPANRPRLGAVLLADDGHLSQLWTGPAADAQPQIQLAAVSLARLLLTICPANIVRMAAPLSPDPASPAHNRSLVHVLLALFSRSDAENTRTEAARALQALCRGLHASDGSSGGDVDVEDGIPILPDAWEPEPEPESAETAGRSNSSKAQRRRARFYEAHPDLAYSLGYLMGQKRFPALRPETWFVAALMCRSDDGARLVLRALLPTEAWRALVEAVTGRDVGSTDGREIEKTSPEAPQPPQAQVDPKQAAVTARAERENALVLLAELVKGYADQLPELRRSMSEQLLQTGGALVVGDRGQLALTGPEEA